MKAATELTLDELYDEFDFLHDWEERCELLIDLGMELEQLSPEEKNEENRVHGCQSMVWMTTELDEQGRMHVRANSDAMLVSGLIVVLLALFDGKTPNEVLDTEVKPVFDKLGLDVHLSTARKNGLAGMVQRVKRDAVSYHNQMEGDGTTVTEIRRREERL
ncbi:SufE family protein [Stratiformator vulcanicus]|uniref:Cysteine desulfuration protein SufE n=1 Tax=Stratiformator vulcanicus TaxID=2527980 RepID=A0A517R1N6_9PLAN|nr:SufE family protein [Stratiformator vulcanicus]QDT37764.1 Cysteine desulfuration protein SufE [Stratiformator vulcanicus]